MKKRISYVLFLLLLLCIKSYGASADRDLFTKIFSQWTEAFNSKNLAVSCSLFSTSVVANYQGTPTKDYDKICKGFKKIFALKNEHYEYSFQLHQIYRSHNLSAVRITWFLNHYKDGKLISTTRDEGLDVFQKSGVRWQIVNYIAYPSTSE